jgi:hypothetical protein
MANPQIVIDTTVNNFAQAANISKLPNNLIPKVRSEKPERDWKRLGMSPPLWPLLRARSLQCHSGDSGIRRPNRAVVSGGSSDQHSMVGVSIRKYIGIVPEGAHYTRNPGSAR